MAARQEIALEPPLAHVLREHLEDAPVPRGLLRPLRERPRVLAAGDLEHISEAVGLELVGRDDPEVALLLVRDEDVLQVCAEGLHVADHRRAAPRELHHVTLERRQVQGDAPVPSEARGVHRETPLAARTEREDVVGGPAVPVEELVGPIGPQPLLEDGQVRGVRPGVRDRNLVRPEGALEPLPVELPGTAEALGCREDDHRPPRPLGRRSRPREALEALDLAVRPSESGVEIGIDVFALVDEPGGIAQARVEAVQLLLGHRGGDRRIRDLEPVQVENR